MNINNNLNSMHLEINKLNQLAKNINESTQMIDDPELNEITQNLIDSIAQQIPTQISYSANGSAITTQNEVLGSTINIKA